MPSSVASPVRPMAVNLRNREIDIRSAMTGMITPSADSGITPRAGLLAGPWNAEASVAGTATQRSTLLKPYRMVWAFPGSYGIVGRQPADHTVDHVASPSGNPRVDLIVARFDGTDHITEVITGTPAAAPLPPAVPADSEPLWEARITPAGAVTYTSRRRWTAAQGGIRPGGVAFGDGGANGAYYGEFRYTADGRIEMWDNAKWVTVATTATWNSYTPQLFYRGGSGGTVGLGTGATRIGRYIIVGSIIHFRLAFRWGTGPFNGGTGDVYTTFPVHQGIQVVSSTSEIARVPCQLYTTSNAPMDWPGLATIFENSNEIRPQFPTAPNDVRMLFYRIAATNGTPNSGVPRVADSGTGSYYPEGGSLVIQGSTEIQPLAAA